MQRSITTDEVFNEVGIRKRLGNTPPRTASCSVWPRWRIGHCRGSSCTDRAPVWNRREPDDWPRLQRI